VWRVGSSRAFSLSHRDPGQEQRRLGDPQYDGGTGVARVIVVAERESDLPDALDGDRRAFQLKERVTSSDARDPHVAAQLIERIGWALADAEAVELRRAARPVPPGRTG
jgi:hypothetical protein